MCRLERKAVHAMHSHYCNTLTSLRTVHSFTQRKRCSKRLNTTNQPPRTVSTIRKYC